MHLLDHQKILKPYMLSFLQRFCKTVSIETLVKQLSKVAFRQYFWLKRDSSNNWSYHFGWKKNTTNSTLASLFSIPGVHPQTLTSLKKTQVAMKKIGPLHCFREAEHSFSEKKFSWFCLSCKADAQRRRNFKETVSYFNLSVKQKRRELRRKEKMCICKSISWSCSAGGNDS